MSTRGEVDSHTHLQLCFSDVVSQSQSLYFWQGAKAAVLNMAEILAQELSPFNVHVTTVIPGWVKSEIVNPQSERFER